MHKHKPVVLIILDGFGIAPPSRANAISLAKTPNFDKYMTNYPVMPLAASGEAVGLSWGEMGNSEVGHLSLGSGKILYQNLPRITKSIADGDFFENKAFLEICQHVKKNNSALHLMGLVSSGGIHSFNEHLYALVELAYQQKIERIYIHAFLDGRDTPHNSGFNFISKLQDKLKIIGSGAIATLAGRWHAMDRDNNWERTEKAFRAIVDGQAKNKFEDPLKAIKNSYDQGVYDEELEPVVIIDDQGQPRGRIKDRDGVIFFNFRADRARQLTKSLVLPGFEKFKRQYFKDLAMVTMTEYESDLPVQVAFPKVEAFHGKLPQINHLPKANALRDKDGELTPIFSENIPGIRLDITLGDTVFEKPSPRQSQSQPEDSVCGIQFFYKRHAFPHIPEFFAWKAVEDVGARWYSGFPA